MSSAHTAGHASPYLAHHFRSMAQQREAATMGMWLFLAQEFMFFGGMFLAYGVTRFMYPEAWVTGSLTLNVWIGAANTVVLLLSSFSIAMGVYYTQINKPKNLVWCLVITLILGLIFVGVKIQWEYLPKISEGVFPGALWAPHGHHYGHLAAVDAQGPLQLFFFMYYLMTGMHAFHMLIGFGLIIWLIVLAAKGRFNSENYMTIMNFGLYWHFVDIVWVFLFPLFYLVR